MHGSDGWLCNLVVGSGLKVGIVGFYFDATKIVRSGDSGVFGLFPPNAGNCQNMTVTVLERRGKLAKNPTNPTSDRLVGEPSPSLLGAPEALGFCWRGKQGMNDRLSE